MNAKDLSDKVHCMQLPQTNGNLIALHCKSPCEKHAKASNRPRNWDFRGEVDPSGMSTSRACLEEEAYDSCIKRMLCRRSVGLVTARGHAHKGTACQTFLRKIK